MWLMASPERPRRREGQSADRAQTAAKAHTPACGTRRRRRSNRRSTGKFSPSAPRVPADLRRVVPPRLRTAPDHSWLLLGVGRDKVPAPVDLTSDLAGPAMGAVEMERLVQAAVEAWRRLDDLHARRAAEHI